MKHRTEAEILADLTRATQVAEELRQTKQEAANGIARAEIRIDNLRAELKALPKRPAEFTWPESNDHWLTMDCDTFAKRVMLDTDITVPGDMGTGRTQKALLANPKALKELVGIAKRIVYYSQDV